MYQYNPQEEYPRPEYLAHLAKIDTGHKLNPVTRTKEPVPPFWCMKVICLEEKSIFFNHCLGPKAASLLAVSGLPPMSGNSVHHEHHSVQVCCGPHILFLLISD